MGELRASGQRLVAAIGAALTLAVGADLFCAVSAAAAPGGFVLATSQAGGSGFAPAFVGNGYLAGRQPADGTGFAQVPLAGSSSPLPTQSEVHGFYADVSTAGSDPSTPPTGLIERRAALPAWSTLTYDDGSGAYSLARGTVRGYRQSLDLRTGTLTTTVTWTSPAGRTARLRYDVTPDRARPHAAFVRLQITPQFSGPVTITDVLDGQAAEFTAPAGVGHAGSTQWVDLTSQGAGLHATVASVLAAAGTAATPVAQPDPQSAAQHVVLGVRAGRTSVVTKAVGVAVSADAGARASPNTRAVSAARSEALLGYRRARVASDAAWSRLWGADVAVTGAAGLQREVRAALFALLASTRDDLPWAPSPGGLSSDGYNGHVFWDSETWMYPTLLATEPGIARELMQYRVDRLAAARANASASGYGGARYPWESALSGAEETPACCDEGKYEVHVSSDIALALWQYWLATGDRRWLATRAWPLLSGIAAFWLTRAQANSDGSYSIDHVIPPDEHADGVNDSVYTNVAARDALQIATTAARALGRTPDPAWARVAGRLRVLFDAAAMLHPEYDGYPGNAVKQADVTLLAYPWENPQSPAVSQNDLNYYVPRTDPGGPSMTDAINAVVTSKLGTPGCSAFSFTERSVQPFMRGPYYQFSESRSGGAFTFTTGAGGFLQEFIYGYTGLRWRSNAVALDPSLPPQLAGVTLSALHWRGRVLRIAVTRRRTRVSLVSGRALRLQWPGHTARLARGHPLVLRTRRPDAAPSSDLARCRPASAAPATAEPPQSADDGSVATTWLAPAPGTMLTVDLRRAVRLSGIEITRPPVLAIASPVKDQKALTGPTRSAGETVLVSPDGRQWQQVAQVAAPGLDDRIAGTGQPVRFVRVVAGNDAGAQHPLVIGELAVTGTG